MASVSPNVAQIKGETQGSGHTALFDPVHLYKGKLRAAATRNKFHDAADLRWLEGKALQMLQQNKGQLAPVYIGLALKRYSELHLSSTRIGFDLEAATAAAASHDSRHPQPGDVQKGLLAPPCSV